MPNSLDFKSLEAAVHNTKVPVLRGRITAAREQVLEAELPGARVGTRVVVTSPEGNRAYAEVATCNKNTIQLLPISPFDGVGPGDSVTTVSLGDSVNCGNGLLGRIVDSSGQPLDNLGPLKASTSWPLRRSAPDPLTRRPIEEQLETGIRVIDGCISLGLGQRLGLFAGPGLGKSTLLGTMARRSAADVNVVCLVGERGREVREFIDHALGAQGLARSVVVLATADAPSLVRSRALETATAIAEWFRSREKNVLLLVDSLTRVIRARRDMALSLGETPARNGFPAAAFSELPALLERAGRDHRGSITAFYAVLTENELVDPIAEEARSLLDGHIVLSPRLAHAGRWPAIDILNSVSRVMDKIVPRDQLEASRILKRLVAAYSENEDLILMGAYRPGTSEDTDMAIKLKSDIEGFLTQDAGLSSPLELTRSALVSLVDGS
jgi:ATP synthase in type III secretion protein N